MNKIIGLLIAALLIITLVVGSTWAFFSDTETSSSNTFTAGTLDLKVSNGTDNYSDGVTATWGGTNAKPGDTFSGTVSLKNVGSLAANHVEIGFENAVTDNSSYDAADLGPNIADMSTIMVVTALSYGGVDLLTQTTPGIFDNLDIRAADTAGNADGIITLNELNGVILGTLTALAVPTPSGAATKEFAMTVSIPSNTGNGIQGDSVTTVVTFGLYQVASQHLSLP